MALMRLWKVVCQTEGIICFYLTLLETTFPWASDMSYYDLKFHLLSPYVCDLTSVSRLLKQAPRLRGPAPWVKGRVRRAKEFLKASVNAFERAVCCYDFLELSLCLYFCPASLYMYRTYVLLWLHVYVHFLYNHVCYQNDMWQEDEVMEQVWGRVLLCVSVCVKRFL